MSMTASSASKVFRESRSIISLRSRYETGRAESAGAARGRLEIRSLTPFDAHIGGNHELRDLHAACDREMTLAVIDKDRHDFAAIIGIDGAGRVQDRNPMAQREPRPR